ncbi:MAG: amino acid ABC transporter permease [Bifidobacteriaceae bacterium]|nr:amino acid ABC transporter permease [Bifidobacteriaceae bacterium]
MLGPVGAERFIMLFDLKVVFEKIPEILSYLPITLEIALIATATSLIIGFLVAWIKIKRIKVLKPLADFYVSFTRGTPIIVQLYTTYFGIPFFLTYFNDRFGWGLNVNGIPPIVFALVALGLNDAAYSSESIRSAILSVEKGQIEAAHSIGMTGWQTLRRVIIPEAAVVAIPNLGNGFINMLKNTSLVFVCGVVEMTAGARLIAGRSYRYFEMYVSLAIIYWILTLIASRLLVRWERSLRRNERDPKAATKAAALKARRPRRFFSIDRDAGANPDAAVDDAVTAATGAPVRPPVPPPGLASEATEPAAQPVATAGPVAIAEPLDSPPLAADAPPLADKRPVREEVGA